ncbi:MAG: TonB-dependent receptor plug domain-containing protein [Rhodothermia bacterium]|nr:TonB-dependent receptor plug domain-containing protein [Rhodothermia bacterium]
MIKYIFIFIIFFGVIHAQPFSGYVKDAQSNEVLIGANIVEINEANGASANRYGFFSIQLRKMPTQIRVSYIGYQSETINVTSQTNRPLIIKLHEQSNVSEVEVFADTPIEEQVQMGFILLKPKDVSNMPTIGGEADVLKTLQWMPGIKGGNEGTAGLHVRGGSPDQNLMLLDGATVYNAQHLFGFISVFNPDALNHIEVYKGNAPARYGGRLSSVIDLQMKEGNAEKRNINAEVGLISSKIMIESPIQKSKSSFLFTVRRTYADVLFAAMRVVGAITKNVDLNYHFTDFNFKTNYIKDTKNRFYFSLYGGKDVYGQSYISGSFGSKEQNEINWGNLTTTLRWNHVLSNKSFMNSSFIYSQYNFNLENSILQIDESGHKNNTLILFSSGIKEVSLKADLEYFWNQTHILKYGFGGIFLHFIPKISIFSEGKSRSTQQVKTNALDNYIYAEDEWSATKRWKNIIGVRADLAVVEGKSYPRIQPRFSTRYLFNKQWSLKGAIGTTQQFIHLLSNSGVGLPTDLWVPSTKRIKPQEALQVSAGIAKTFSPNKQKLEISIEIYHKEMKHLLEYKEGVSVVDGDDWQNRVVQGTGIAKGMELFIQKRGGKWQGWLGYTLSESKRNFIELNEGRAFLYRYDRKHNFSIVASRDVNQRTYTLAWTYGTGQAITFPIGYYYINGERITIYSEKNGYRLPATHHLDIGIRRRFEEKRRETMLSIYNVYSHKNPFYVYTDGGDQEVDPFLGTIQSPIKIKQISIFPIIPTLSFKLYF